MSVVELDAALITLLNKKSNSSSTSTFESAISSPVLASNVIAISVMAVSSNMSLSTAILPKFEASLSLSSRANADEEMSSLHHNCSVGVADTASGLCRSSQVWLNVTCSGKSFAMVKRSCPVFHHVCTVLNLADNTIASTDYCQTITTGRGLVNCRCGFDASSARNSSQMLAGLNSKVSVAALESYSSSAIDSSVVQVVTPVVGDITDSVLVFVAFGGVWAVGIMGILYIYWKDSIKVSIGSFPTLHENKGVREAAIDYLYMVLPVSLQVENWWVARIWHILSIKH